MRNAFQCFAGTKRNLRVLSSSSQAVDGLAMELCTWRLREIKHDGFRIIARKQDAQVRLYSRPGNDLTRRFPLIVETLARLRSRSCIIDGEAVACDDNIYPSFT